MNCDIIIPVWNQLEVTKECVDSIIRNTDYPYRLVIVDNGSGWETEGYLLGLKERQDLNVLLIRNSENLGFVKAVNQGIAASSAPYLCIMNNDTVATAGWLTELVKIAESGPSIGLVNPSSNTSGQFPGRNESIDDYAATLKRFKGQTQELYTCRGFCMLIKREVIGKLGALDEIYHMGYFDDTDYCKRAQMAGFRTVRAKASYVYHKENTSFKKLADNSVLFKKNEKIFFKRWGRPVRVGYFVDHISSKDRIDAIAKDVARAGHQISIFLKKGLEWPVSLDHFDIRRVDINANFFGIVSIYKILKRKKKKKLEVLVTDDAILAQIFMVLRHLHEADVMVNPGRSEVLNLLAKKSACL